MLTRLYLRSVLAALLVGALYHPASHHLWSMVCWIALASWWVVDLFLGLAMIERIEESMLPRELRFVGSRERKGGEE